MIEEARTQQPSDTVRIRVTLNGRRYPAPDINAAFLALILRWNRRRLLAVIAVVASAMVYPLGFHGWRYFFDQVGLMIAGAAWWFWCSAKLKEVEQARDKYAIDRMSSRERGAGQ